MFVTQSPDARRIKMAVVHMCAKRIMEIQTVQTQENMENSLIL
jgi:hypothetical protein